MLEVRNVSKAFGGKTILRDLSLGIGTGEIVSVLGPSGSGKTTLLNLILGLTRPDSGRILYDGEDLTDVPAERRRFNIVFQDYALFPNLDARANILYGLRNHPDASSAAEVDALVDLLGLREHLGKRIDQLSGGQRQRVALARTLVLKPRVLLLDEPLSALDGVIKESIKARIRQIAREFRLTTLIVTHDPEEALTLADRVLVLEGGGIAQYARPAELIGRPANGFVKAFILRQLEIKRENILALFQAARA